MQLRIRYLRRIIHGIDSVLNVLADIINYCVLYTISLSILVIVNTYGKYWTALTSSLLVLFFAYAYVVRATCRIIKASASLRLGKLKKREVNIQHVVLTFALVIYILSLILILFTSTLFYCTIASSMPTLSAINTTRLIEDIGTSFSQGYTSFVIFLFSFSFIFLAIAQTLKEDPQSKEPQKPHIRG